MYGILNNLDVILPKRFEWEEFYLRVVYVYLLVQREVRRMCRGLEAWQIVTNTVLCFFALWMSVEILRWTYWWIFMQEEGIAVRLKKTFFKIAKSLPFLKQKELIASQELLFQIKMKLDLKKSEMEKDLLMNRNGEIYVTKLPKKGLSKEELLSDIVRYEQMGNIPWDMGSGVVYHGGKEMTEIQTQVFRKFVWSNPLHIDVFPGVCKMEAEVVQMCVNLFNGGENTCGTMTSSGTESLLLACKTYRDWGRDIKGITRPEIVVPESAHAAFEKGAQYFKMKIIKVAVNKEERTVNIKAMRKAITGNTVMLVGSAPEFPYGVIDNIEEIAKLGKRYNIGVHVDACLGGFVLAFMNAAGFKVPPYDFSVDGVTSLSADAHKYGCAPKGSSLILYHHQSLMHYQYHLCPNWTGGIYATRTMPGSRPGVLVAQCWTTMMHLGKSGYVDSTRRIVRTTRAMRNGLRKTKGIFVFGDPEVCVVAFGSKQFDIFALGDELTARHWKLNALQFPSSLHICVTRPMAKPGMAEKFLKDVRECSNKILKKPDWKTTGTGAIYGMAQKIPDRSMVKELVNHYLDCLYSVKTELS